MLRERTEGIIRNLCHQSHHEMICISTKCMVEKLEQKGWITRILSEDNQQDCWGNDDREGGNEDSRCLSMETEAVDGYPAPEVDRH